MCTVALEPQFSFQLTAGFVDRELEATGQAPRKWVKAIRDPATEAMAAFPRRDEADASGMSTLAWARSAGCPSRRSV